MSEKQYCYWIDSNDVIVRFWYKPQGDFYYVNPNAHVADTGEEYHAEFNTLNPEVTFSTFDECKACMADTFRALLAGIEAATEHDWNAT